MKKLVIAFVVALVYAFCHVMQEYGNGLDWFNN